MDPAPDLGRTRALTLAALGCALAAPLAAASSVFTQSNAVPAGVALLCFAQFVLGLVAFVGGRRAVERPSPQPSPTHASLRRWSGIGLAVGIIGIFEGAALVIAVVALQIYGGAMSGV